MPGHVLTRQQVRDVDERAMSEYGIPGVVLMENAGRGCAELLGQLGINGRVVVCCGKGNNGGDGFVIARHLENAGHAVEIASAVDTATLEGDAAINAGILAAAGFALEPPSSDQWDSIFADASWIVDALLGTGTQGAVREPFTTVIDAINRAPVPVLAVDLPSGLDCDTGNVLGCCVRADHTATLVAPKPGFAAPGAAECTGTVHVIEIGIPRQLRDEVLGNVDAD